MDSKVAVVGLIVGLLVGMGGGALTTPSLNLSHGGRKFESVCA